MNQLRITLRSEDCRETKYYHSLDCAITRALRRAGKNWRHTGLDIFPGSSEIGTPVVEGDKSNLEALNALVCQLYDHCRDETPIPEVDFILEWE